MTWIIVSCTFAVLLAALIFLWRRYHLPNLYQQGVEPWGARTITWLRNLATSGVESSGARFSDFVGLAGFSLSILVIVLGWYSIVLQAQKAELEQEMRDFSTKIADKEKQIEAAQRWIDENKLTEHIHLAAPRRDADIIGNHVDLSWSYVDHSPFITYVVELWNKQQSDSKAQFVPGAHPACTLSSFNSCRFLVTDPAGQHTQISKDAKLSGDYLWRVAPARRAVNITENYESDRVGDWSQFRAFSIYPTIKERILKTHRVLVGTTYAEDSRFSSLGSDGKPTGHDIDLVKILVEGCLALTPDGGDIAFEQPNCRDAVNQYHGPNPLVSKGGLQVKIKPYSSISEGMDALGRREVDLFIGSLTKAKQRERGPIRFTDGYYRFTSRLYAKPERDINNISEWTLKKRTIGCINRSSNYWLASLLAGEDTFKHQLTIVTFDTFPGMENAFDRGEVDGLLLDDVLSDQLREAVPIEGIENTEAWKSYHSEETALGFPQEEFAIAVVLDAPGVATIDSGTLIDRIAKLFRRKEDDPDQFLLRDLQRALSSQEIQRNLLPNLRTMYGIPESPNR